MIRSMAQIFRESNLRSESSMPPELLKDKLTVERTMRRELMVAEFLEGKPENLLLETMSGILWWIRDLSESGEINLPPSNKGLWYSINPEKGWYEIDQGELMEYIRDINPNKPITYSDAHLLMVALVSLEDRQLIWFQRGAKVAFDKELIPDKKPEHSSDVLPNSKTGIMNDAYTPLKLKIGPRAYLEVRKWLRTDRDTDINRDIEAVLNIGEKSV